MKRNYFKSITERTPYAEIISDANKGAPCAVQGLSSAHKAFIASLLSRQVIYVCADSVAAKRAVLELSGLTGDKVIYLKGKDEVLLYKAAVSREQSFDRICALYELQTLLKAGSQDGSVVVVEAEALIQLCPEKIDFLAVKCGQVISRDEFVSRLIEMGYSREYEVNGRGAFAVRGDIIDLYPINCENPVRIDFFDDLIEKIKPYDFNSGERLPAEDELEVVACSEARLSAGEGEALLEFLDAQLDRFKSASARVKAQTVCDNLADKLTSGVADAYLLPALRSAGDAFGYFSPDAVICYDEPKIIDDRLNGVLSEHYVRYNRLFEAGEALPVAYEQLISRDALIQKTAKFRQLALMQFLTDARLFNPLKAHVVKGTPTAKYYGTETNLINDIKAWLSNGYRIIVFCGGVEKLQKLRQALSDEYIAQYPQADFVDGQKGICLLEDEIDRGVIIHSEKLVLLGTADVFARASSVKRVKKKRNDMFIAPEVGDFVVHETHGVGKIVGTRRIESTDGTKEYVSVEYEGGDLLHVPVEQMDVLSKYIGDEHPSLSKIGGVEFERVKERVRKSLKALAIDLKSLYAERQSSSGYVFDRHESLMDEFEGAFAFTETADQSASIEEIKNDMCSSKVMDRLLCGDVGYGKTEVAYRAAYLAVLNGKQVAFMCPNTVLCRQHYNTAKERFEPFGLIVASIDRFKSESEQTAILSRLARGEIDILIGTHRLLSKDVVFKNLGLLVLDEEQRFGVEHKEKLKTVKQNVDCLTMTATPIPRTLHMSLTGIRDISTIETPPCDRLPVQTYVVEESDAVIRDACLRELARGGQIFILYNRVESINTFAARISALMPEAKLTVVHGQMNKQSLEDSIIKFYSGETDILVTTTIIENGIDMPNANTIIIIDSDRLGVSQLYQLRGRVGRSSRLAHAYFMFKPERVLTETANERLNAIMEFTELGSGFKIAMRDLEIRGAGDVLGARQHGHMERVGYELYAKLLKEAMTGEVYTAVDLDIKATAYIPDAYIPSSAGRLDCYKQIAEIRNTADYKRVFESIEDNYGKMPPEMSNLLVIAVLKSAAADFYVKKIGVSSTGGYLVFPSIKSLADEGIRVSLDEMSKKITLDMASSVILRFGEYKSAQKVMLDMVKFLKNAATFNRKR